MIESILFNGAIILAFLALFVFAFIMVMIGSEHTYPGHPPFPSELNFWVGIISFFLIFVTISFPYVGIMYVKFGIFIYSLYAALMMHDMKQNKLAIIQLMLGIAMFPRLLHFPRLVWMGIDVFYIWALNYILLYSRREYNKKHNYKR